MTLQDELQQAKYRYYKKNGTWISTIPCHIPYGHEYYVIGIADDAVLLQNTYTDKTTAELYMNLPDEIISNIVSHLACFCV